MKISPTSPRAQGSSAFRVAKLFVEEIKNDAMTPSQILDVIDYSKSKENLFRLLALASSDPEGSVTLSRMHALNIFGNRSLINALRRLVWCPTQAEGVSRLSNEQQIAFLDLIRKPERERTPRELLDAGVLTCGDYESPHLDHIKSDEFLRGWLDTGYVHTEGRIASWYPINLTHADFPRALAGASRPYERDCVHHVDFGHCDMRHAKLDTIRFYKCNFLAANLQDATIHGGDVEDCNHTRDRDDFVRMQLGDLGLIGLPGQQHVDEYGEARPLPGDRGRLV